MHTYFTLSEVAQLAGEFDESRDALDAGLAVARTIDQRVGVAYGLSRRAGHCFTQGQLSDAREAATAAHDIYRQLGSPSADYIAANILLYDIEEERFSGALERAQKLLQTWQNYGLERRLPALLLSVAVCLANEGDDQAAREQYERAMASSRTSGRVVDDTVFLTVLLADHTHDAELRREALDFVADHRALLPARYVERLQRLH
jgi:tetratricopeptide (TPR) repeat protein